MSEQSVTPDIVSVFLYARRAARAECSCGWDGKLRRHKATATLDALLHAANKGCIENWPLVYDDRPPRRFPAAAAVGWLGAAALIIGGSLGFSAPAHADVADDYAANVYPVICKAIAERPYIDTVETVVQSIVEVTGESYEFAGAVVGVSVRDYCPWNRSTVERFINKYIPGGGSPAPFSARVGGRI